MQTTIQTKVLRKALGDEQFEAVMEKYNNNVVRRAVTEPTELQRQIAVEAKQIGIWKTSKNRGVDPNIIRNAVKRVATWDYLNGK
jgi:hypothetical protein